MRRLSVIIVFVLVFSSLLTAVHAKAAESLPVEDYVTEFKQRTKCEAVSVVVHDAGELAYYGDVDKSALYQIGSMTKAFTGLGAMKLVSEGRLSLESRVSDYIPGFEVYFEGERVDILIRDLLTQTSGFTNAEKVYPSATKDMTLSMWVESISGKRLAYRPGEQYAYSNVNYNLLGALIETVSGKSYKDYMEEEILKPLGLNHTFVGFPAEEQNIIDGTRLGYRRVHAFKTDVKEGAIPAGYFYSTIEDMGRWLMIWGGVADIPKEYRQVIEKIRQTLAQDADCFAGWETFGSGDIGHSGGTSGYSSRIVYSAESPAGVCVLTNLNVAASTDRLCNDIYAELTGETPAGFVSDVWTIFDIIFTGLTLLGLLVLFLGIYGRRHTRVLIIFDAVVTTLLISMLVILPIIFQASLHELLFVWAPWSMSGGMLVLALDVVILTIMTGMWKKHENRNKKSGKPAVNRYC